MTRSKTEGEESEAKCGVVAVVGAPNAGKSTLVNAMVGQKVAIVSPKVQTTRTRLMGIAMQDSVQLMLVDTPGIFAPRRRLERAMVAAAWEGAEGADAILLVVDARGGFKPEVEAIVERLTNRPEPKLLALNKVDISKKEKLLPLAARLNDLVGFQETMMISASTGDGIPYLKARLASMMPPGPWHYPEDQLSDVTTRLLAAEITREKLYLQLHEELPYACTIETEKWEERGDGSVAIYQQILVAKDTQKAIILGKGGHQIKALGAAARADLAEQLGRRVHLFLHVKVKADWADDRGVYRDMGLGWVE